MGTSIPADHAYALYGAICRQLPHLHGDESIGIHAVNGRLAEDRTLTLDRHSRLSFRIAADRIKEFLPLSGRTLVLDGAKIRIGAPSVFALLPVACLYSRLVIIKGFMEPDGFMKATMRQMEDLDINGRARLIDSGAAMTANTGKKGGTHSPFLRRTLRIREKIIVGFAVLVDGLSDEDSMNLQQNGLGGRRRFGCGLFIPFRNVR